MSMRTRGACFASVQNKCAVLNICTLSGDVFWKLYRYTGEDVFMDTIVAYLHNAQQYIATCERPIASPKLKDKVLEPGNMNGCIQTGDWSGPPGEIPYHLPISWSEAANMLGICAIPGIYVRKDRSQVFVADHLEVTLIDEGEGRVFLRISNPTAYDAETTLFTEDAGEAGVILSSLSPPAFTRIRVPSGGQLSVPLY